MANYDFKESPTYQTQIRALDNNDPANAETILNPVIETLLNNTHAAKLSAEQHHEDNNKHITTLERQKINGIDEGANKYTHPNSGIVVGTYRSVTVNSGGHVTTGSNPTTISGYGLTDAYTKNEVDTKITTHTSSTSSHVSTTDRTNWNDASSKKHEHSNKTVLDGITSTKISNWDSASTNNHTHGNKAILDGVTSAKITNWDSASANSHTHSNKSVLDGVTGAKITNWDNASTNSHTHSNKPALDGISSTKVTSWDNASTNNHTHSNKGILDSISQPKINTWDGYEQKIASLNSSLTNSMPMFTLGFQRADTNNLITANTWTKIPLVNIVSDGNGYFDISNGMLRNISGKSLWCRMSASVYYDSVANAGHGAGIGINDVDGTVLYAGNSWNYVYQQMPTAASRHIVTNEKMYFNKLKPGQYLVLYGFCSIAGSKTNTANSRTTCIDVISKIAE